jgi:putative membrane protein
MKAIVKLLLGGLAVLISAYIIPGILVPDFGVAIVVSVVLSIVNFLIKPLLVILTLPVNIMTLGLFTLIINALMIEIVAMIVPGFGVENFLVAILFGIVLSLVNGFLSKLAE